MSRKFLGLEIGIDTLSAVVVENGFKRNKIITANRAPIPSDMEKEQGIAAAIETIMKDVDISGMACAISIPSFLVSYRNISVPFKNRKKINQILPFELEPTLPFPAGDMLIDFDMINLPDTTDHMDIIAAAVEKSRIETYLDILKPFKIKPKIVTTGGYATAMCLSKLAEVPEKWLLIHMDQSNCAVFTGRSRQIDLIRSFQIPENPSRKMRSLAANIQQTLAAHEGVFKREFNPDHVWISGNGKQIADLDTSLETRLETTVEWVDFSANVGLSLQKPTKSMWQSDVMTNALALAIMVLQGMKGINFYKGTFVKDTFFSKYKSNLIAAGALAVFVLTIFGGSVFLETRFLEKKLSNLNQQITRIFKDTFPEVQKVVDPLQQMRVKMQELNQNASFSRENDINLHVIDILNDISKNLPKSTDVEFKRLVINPDNLLIDGETADFNLVDDIKGRLEKIPYFSKVTITSANMDKSGAHVKFKLKIQFRS